MYFLIVREVNHIVYSRILANYIVEQLLLKEWFSKKTNIVCRHRKEKPAEERSDGINVYWENGVAYQFDDGIKIFQDLFGRFHRHSLPAIEYSNGDKEWWLHGERHRENGPAVIYGNKQFWFEHGEFIKCTHLL